MATIRLIITRTQHTEGGLPRNAARGVSSTIKSKPHAGRAPSARHIDSSHALDTPSTQATNKTPQYDRGGDTIIAITMSTYITASTSPHRKQLSTSDLPIVPHGEMATIRLIITVHMQVHEHTHIYTHKHAHT